MRRMVEAFLLSRRQSAVTAISLEMLVAASLCRGEPELYAKDGRGAIGYYRGDPAGGRTVAAAVIDARSEFSRNATLRGRYYRAVSERRG